VALASSVNYVVGDRWVFGGRRARAVVAASPTPGGAPAAAAELPPVSVVIPVRDSAATIAATVASVRAQDYEGPIEVIAVGSCRDSTWQALRDEIAAETVTAYELDVDAPGRDTAAKRTLGFDHASGAVLCSIDSDTHLPPGWIATAVRLVQSGWDGAGGPCVSLDDDYWGEYVDRNRFGCKTPRMDVPYVFDAGTLGRRGHKLPVTGCSAFTAEVYAAVGGFDKDFVWTYDDYEFFQRVAEHGFRMLCTPELVIGVHHRSRFRPLLREYWESGAGCAQFVRKFPASRFSVARLRQLVLVATAAVTALVFPVYVVLGAAVGLIALGLATVRSGGRWRAFPYPAITFVLGLVFVFAMAFQLVAGAVHRPETRVGAHTRRQAGGEVVCGGACQNVVAMHDAGDDLAVDLARAAARS
jgi:glycosyltransferase involved in cell wall biosynthesis